MNSDNKNSCRNLFKKLCDLFLQSQYILSLLMFVVKNMDLFKMNSDIHNFNTRFNHDIYSCSKFGSISERSMVLWY